MDALIDEEQTGKKKKKRKKQGADLQPSYSGTFGTSYDPQGSYGEAILVTPPANRENYNIHEYVP